ncbi:MAG: rubrerythrin family protein [Bacteroidetes bacterium HGW-Bacteroidetes-3]|jgi:VIT1/CCC1 family predicted Fe2+/Mn2+ transporter|nr:MAG: rubrerythrin family protein [Bacteroidetes bacterium HGW-Bacteroidetes-3]
MNLEKAIQTEIDTAFLYHEMVKISEDEELKIFYGEMAAIENRHVEKFYAKIAAYNPKYKLAGPSLRARIIANLGKRFGSNIILSTLSNTEKSMSLAALNKKQKNNEPIIGSEARHFNILKSMESFTGEGIGKIEGRHRTVGGNALRAAVLGANDGLVSNLSLVMGVAGVTMEGNGVLIAGLAGLLAGAISMALGEWISVRSSQELYERQIELEFEEIENNPEEEKQELILLYRAKGFSEEEATNAVTQIWDDPEKAKQVLVTEELGINPDELGGSAWEAAFASFFLFLIGAIIPVFPFFFAKGFNAVIFSAIASTFGLFGIGAAITLITGKSFVKSGFRQVLFGLAAAAITFGIGHLIGVSIAG